MSIVILGIDLGKNLCSVVGLDEAGAVMLRRSMRRQSVLGYHERVGIEALAQKHRMFKPSSRGQNGALRTPPVPGGCR